jgi:arylsulfatase A-like enzyme
VTDADYIASLYDGEINHVDEGVAQLLEALEKTGAADDTLVILTADHGEVMTRNGIFFDHHGLYEENVRVPLILRLPDRLPAGRRVSQMIQHLDFAPTLLRLAGSRVPQSMEGKDFWPLAEGTDESRLWERVVCCENTWQAKWAVRTDQYKFILSRFPDRYGTPMRELYHLCDDPGESRSIAETETQTAEELEQWLEEWIAAGLARTGRAEDPLRAQSITLGRRWDDWLKRQAGEKQT